MKNNPTVKKQKKDQIVYCVEILNIFFFNF